MGKGAVSAVPHPDDDPVADGDVLNVAVNLDHVSSGFDARCERQIRLELIFARHHQDVREIDAGGANGDAHLTCAE